MFIAVGYEFSNDDRAKIKAKLSVVERDLFSRYLEADLICLEEEGDTIPVSKLFTNSYRIMRSDSRTLLQDAPVSRCFYLEVEPEDCLPVNS